MRLASWNVNSIRARLDGAVEWVEEHQPDVLCLQETKVVDDDFPTEPFTRLGYEVARAGQRTYNGVAILAREPLRDLSIGLLGAAPDDDQRLIRATVRDVHIVCVYVPNGKHVGHPDFDKKLAWLESLRTTLDTTADPNTPLLLCGDFNVARDRRDVHDPERALGQVLFTDEERAALERVIDFGFDDAVRHLHDEDGLYSWWDYRAGAFRRNRGYRIDYAFTTKPLTARLKHASIDRSARGRDKPSDHAPVVIDID